MEKDSTTTIDVFSEILPPEVTHAILSYLSPIDVVNASQVSKTFAGLLDSRGIWKRIVEEQFGPLDEQIFKGNIINWRRTFSHCSELQKWKKHFLTGQVVTAQNVKNLYTPSKMMQKVGSTDTSMTFYRDKAKKKQFACLHSAEGYHNILLGYSLKYVLVRFGDKIQLWDLTVDCKHTNDHKWKSALNKTEACKKKCSFVRDISKESKMSDFYWSEEANGVLFMTAESIVSIDLNTGEESSCELPIEKYGEKLKPAKSHPNADISQHERILEVRVMNVNGVSMTFCHVRSINGTFFVNLTTKRVHLFVDKACKIAWISKSLKVAVISATGEQMRVVNIAEEQPKIVAKFNFDQKMGGAVSSPEGHVLFVWRSNTIIGARSIRAYLWEIGYLLGEISTVFPIFSSYWPSCDSCWRTDEASGKHQLVIKARQISFYS